MRYSSGGHLAMLVSTHPLNVVSLIVCDLQSSCD